MVEQQANPPTAHTYIYLFIYTHTRRAIVWIMMMVVGRLIKYSMRRSTLEVCGLNLNM